MPDSKVTLALNHGVRRAILDAQKVVMEKAKGDPKDKASEYAKVQRRFGGL
jgi:hypothetical protein